MDIALVLLQDALREVVQHLEDMNVAAALLGGLAVSVWAEPRFTRDVDLAVAVSSDAEAERVIHGLQLRGYRVLATVEQTAHGRLATARLLPPGESEDGMVVDLLLASSMAARTSSGSMPDLLAAGCFPSLGDARPRGRGVNQPTDPSNARAAGGASVILSL